MIFPYSARYLSYFLHVLFFLHILLQYVKLYALALTYKGYKYLKEFSEEKPM